MTTLHEPTNGQRAESGRRCVALFVGHAVAAGADLTEVDRADLGRRMVEAYSGEPIPGDDLGTVIAFMAADLYHHADATMDPAAMLGAALTELSAAVNTVPVLVSLGEEGRPGILACALAAAIAYAESVGVCPVEITDMALTHWSDEVEEERFMRARAERQHHSVGQAR
ncbi:hypothetical protein EDD99_0175 [Streptomyces sp. 846.5]|nr:hypothetical protein [Streptomyces sp. 846.5]TDU01801.1 hypothetical protein EDD99_0175 [Streptomyces sp. 846.5]